MIAPRTRPLVRDSKRAAQFLDAEDDAGERGIESGRNARRGAGEQQSALIFASRRGPSHTSARRRPER